MRIRFAVAIAGFVLAGARAAAQSAPESAGPVHATRAELEAHVRGLEETATAPGVDDAQRTQLRLQVAAARARLTSGDFRAGDRVAIKVEHFAHPQPATATPSAKPLEQQLSDTFTVDSSQELNLPIVGAVSLRGVLRAELEPYLTAEIGRFIREPVLHARALIRLSVQGAVARPGYYTLSIDAALSDALMAAGGPARGAKIGKLRIEREGKPMIDGPSLQRAIAEGRTLGEMSLLAGDQFMLPEPRPVAERTLRTIGLALAIPVAIFTLTRD